MYIELKEKEIEGVKKNTFDNSNGNTVQHNSCDSQLAYQCAHQYQCIVTFVCDKLQDSCVLKQVSVQG